MCCGPEWIMELIEGTYFRNKEELTFKIVSFNDQLVPIPKHNSPLIVARNDRPFDEKDYLPVWPNDSCILTDTDTEVNDDVLLEEIDEAEQILPAYPASKNLEDLIISEKHIDKAFIYRLSRATYEETIPNESKEPKEIYDFLETDSVPVPHSSLYDLAFELKSERNEVVRTSGDETLNYENFMNEICPVCMQYSCQLHDNCDKEIYRESELQIFRDQQKQGFPTPIYESEISRDSSVYSQAIFSIHNKQTAKYHERRMSLFMEERKVRVVGQKQLENLYPEELSCIPPLFLGLSSLDYRQMTRSEILSYLQQQSLIPSELSRSQMNLVEVLIKVADGNIPLLAALFNVAFDEILLVLVSRNELAYGDEDQYANVLRSGEITEQAWTDSYPGYLKISAEEQLLRSKIASFEGYISERSKRLEGNAAGGAAPDGNTRAAQSITAFPYCEFASFVPLLQLREHAIYPSYSAYFSSTLQSPRALSLKTQSAYLPPPLPIFSNGLDFNMFPEACYHPGLPCAPQWCSCCHEGAACTTACSCYRYACEFRWAGCREDNGCFAQNICCHPDDCVQFRQFGAHLRETYCQVMRALQKRDHHAAEDAVHRALSNTLLLPLYSQISLRISFPFKTILVASLIHGFGVEFTEEYKLPNNFPILEYCGELVDTQQAEKRGRVGDAYGLTYLFSLQGNNLKAPELDAGVRGNLSRYINHQEQGNCYAKQLRNENEIIISLISEQSRKHVVCGELTFNYGKEFISKIAKVVLKQMK